MLLDPTFGLCVAQLYVYSFCLFCMGKKRKTKVRGRNPKKNEKAELALSLYHPKGVVNPTQPKVQLRSAGDRFLLLRSREQQYPRHIFQDYFHAVDGARGSQSWRSTQTRCCVQNPRVLFLKRWSHLYRSHHPVGELGSVPKHICFREEAYSKYIRLSNLCHSASFRPRGIHGVTVDGKRSTCSSPRPKKEVFPVGVSIALLARRATSPGNLLTFPRSPGPMCKNTRTVRGRLDGGRGGTSRKEIELQARKNETLFELLKTSRHDLPKLIGKAQVSLFHRGEQGTDQTRL